MELPQEWVAFGSLILFTPAHVQDVATSPLDANVKDVDFGPRSRSRSPATSAQEPVAGTPPPPLPPPPLAWFRTKAKAAGFLPERPRTGPCPSKRCRIGPTTMWLL
eukprot:15476388-Alexandrium_andersonii.AAC.1